jgi:hypothetical protein
MEDCEECWRVYCERGAGQEKTDKVCVEVLISSAEQNWQMRGVLACLL